MARASGAFGPDDVLDVELGLTALSLLAPGERAESFFTLLRGYPVGRIAARARSWTPAQRQALGVARQLLAHIKSRYAWRAALQVYRGIDEQYRGYTLATDLGKYVQRPVSVLARRFDLYARTLAKGPPYSRRLLVAGPLDTSYQFREGPRTYSFRAPAALPALPMTPTHDLAGAASRTPFQVTRAELLETARWMDQTLDRGYERAIERLRMRLFNADRTVLEPSETLTIA